MSPVLSSPPLRDNAHAWLLMKGDSYLPGIVVSVYSVLRTKPDADLVVMVTPDVSESARQAILKAGATHLFYADYITFESLPLKTDRMTELYSKWMSSAYTKWNALALPYKKVLLIDADIIITDNIDHLFKVNTPACLFNNAFMRPVGRLPNTLPGNNYLPNGARLSAEYVAKALKDGPAIGISCTTLLSPNVSDYNLFLTSVKEPFGYPNVMNVHDEQSLAYFYAVVKREPFYNLHQRYSIIPWKDGYLSEYDVPYGIHYFSDTKPWNASVGDFDDLVSWYKMAGELLVSRGMTAEEIKVKQQDIDLAKTTTDTFIKKFINVESVLHLVNRLTVDK